EHAGGTHVFDDAFFVVHGDGDGGGHAAGVGEGDDVGGAAQGGAAGDPLVVHGFLAGGRGLAGRGFFAEALLLRAGEAVGAGDGVRGGGGVAGELLGEFTSFGVAVAHRRGGAANADGVIG